MSVPSALPRRRFLKRMASGTVAASAMALSSRMIRGANERVRVGLIGCGGRGRLVARLMNEVPDVEFSAVCDVYDRQTNAAKEWAGARCRAFGDFRRVLESKDVDAVLIATPDHWHAIPAVLACQAGKDIYIEKPLGHTIREGRAIVDAARKHERIVQAGTQHRSAPHYRTAAEIVKSGALGSIRFVRIWNYLNMSPDGIGRAADSEPPPGVNWEMYLGPAPRVPFNRNRFIATYRWFWDYGGGMITDFGTHRFDSLHQVMSADTPLSVTATGGRFELRDGAETPDVLQATFEYPGFILSYEASMINGHGTGVRIPGKKYYNARGLEDRPHGEAFYGTNGTLFSDRIGFEIYPEPKAQMRLGPAEPGRTEPRGLRMEPEDVRGEDATQLHVKNFIECVRSRRLPNADVEIGHRASIVAHLGNIAFRTGRKIRWDSATEQIIGDAEAAQLLARKARAPWDLI